MTSAVTQSLFAFVIASARDELSHGSIHFSAEIAMIFAWSVFIFAFAFAFLSFWAWTVGQRHIEKVY